MPQGGKPSPAGDGASPVAFAIAAISSADLVPSRKELNIRELMPAACACSAVRP